MSLGTTYSPQSPWEGLQVTNFYQCLHIVVVIGKRTDYMFRELSIEEFVMGEENSHEGSAGFSSIIKKKQ